MIAAPDYIPDFRRLWCLRVAILAMLGVLVARLWYLQIVKGAELTALSTSLRSRVIRRVAARGEILDSSGQKLATNRSHYVVSILPDEIKKNPDVVPRLAPLLQMTPEDLTATIRKNKTTAFDPVPVASDVDINLLTQIEEQKLDLPGVIITRDPVREYVDNQLCTHVLGLARPISAEKLAKLQNQGYHGGDIVGVEGLEAVYEPILRGQDGGQRIEVDARGRMRHLIEEIKPVPGATLRLTIDRNLQRVAYEALKDEVGKGHPGAAVALDVQDGAVLAFVSAPSYDLNTYGKEYPNFRKDPLFPLINRVSGSYYPSGSPFKLITAAAGLQTGAVTKYSRDYCSGRIRLGNFTFHCDKRSGHGSLDFTNAIGKSCDVYFYDLGRRIGPEAMAAMAKRFGLGAKTGIDLPPSVDAKGIVPSPDWKRKRRKEAWRPGDTVNMAIGQGYVGVTPLQLACYAAALANGGDLLRPQLVREIIDSSGGKPVVTHRLEREVRSNLGLSPENRDAIVEGMVKAMEPGGTAAHCAIPGIAVAGKTGTAEVYIHKQPANNSVFICFAPADHPRIAVAVLVEGGGFGADTAAPIARRLLGQYFGLHLENTPIGHHVGAD